MSSSQTRIDTQRDSYSSFGGGPSLVIPGAVMTFVTLAALMHPNPLVLMLLSIIFVLAALVLAGIELVRALRKRSPPVERLALAALIYFFGCAAAMLGDPDAAVQTLNATR